MTVNSDKYLKAVQAKAGAIGDPIQRARMVSDEISALGTALEALGALRSEAVRTARETMSAVAVADALGVTRARVYQLVE